MHYLLPLIEKTAGYWANLTGKAARTAKETLETAEAAHKPLATASKASAVKLKAALHKLRDTTRGTAPKPSVWKRDLFDWSGVGAATKGSENALNELTASLATAKASTANKRAARDTYIEAVKDRKISELGLKLAEEKEPRSVSDIQRSNKPPTDAEMQARFRSAFPGSR